MKKLDLTGQRYGRLTAISLSDKKQNGKTFWNCICDCGNYTTVSTNNLRTGKVKSCGCAHKLAKLEDLTNQIFGDLTVLELDTSKNYSRIHWKCKCKCGNYISVAACHLKSGIIQSCGCKNNISQGEEKIKNILTANNIPFIQHYYININNKKYYYDFYVNNQYFIEYDGIQHFQYRNSGWNTEENFVKVIKNDNIKNNYCKENNITLIRIPYTIFKTLNIKDLQLETTQYLLCDEVAV